MYKIRSRFPIVLILKRRIVGLLSFLWLLLLFCILVALLSRGSTFDEENGLHVKQDIAETEASHLDQLNSTKTHTNEIKKKFDILINSYMRSGSSFTGQLLAFRHDTFYWYEPLLSYHGLYYFMGQYACIGNSICGDFGTQMIDEVNALLRNIYTCNVTSCTTAIADNITSEYSGEKWKPFNECRAKNKSVETCLAVMENICRLSKHRAAKVVRLTVDNLEYILEHNKNLKVIHLFRDPRAIINSELTTKWYNLNSSGISNFSQIESNAYELCSRLKYDLLQGEKLKRKFSQRFAFVMFEDLQLDMKFKTEMLYSYFGIDEPSVESKLKSLPGILQEEHLVKRKHGDYTDWWRFQLEYKAAKIIDNVCSEVLSFFGYRQFSDISEYRNTSYIGFDFRNEFLLRNLNKTVLYNFEELRNSSKTYVRNIITNPGENSNVIKQQQLTI